MLSSCQVVTASMLNKVEYRQLDTQDCPEVAISKASPVVIL